MIVATGGLPNTEILEEGNGLAVSTWDILSGNVKPAEEVLLFGDDGGHPRRAEALQGLLSSKPLGVIRSEDGICRKCGRAIHTTLSEAPDKIEYYKSNTNYACQRSDYCCVTFLPQRRFPP